MAPGTFPEAYFEQLLHAHAAEDAFWHEAEDTDDED
jgi:hypothetical protein